MDENRDYKLVVISPLCLMPSIWASWICVVAVLKFITEALVNKHGFLIGGVFCFCFLISINLWFFYRFHFATVKSKNHTQSGI